MSKNFQEQAKTLKDAMKLLKKYKKCIVIRPTGFGKTWLLTELIKSYNKVLYLYPAAVIRDTVVNRYYDLPVDPDDDSAILDPETIDTYKEMNYIENCDLMTYAKLIRLSNDDIETMDYDLIIFDEAHRLGGRMTKIATEKLFAKSKSSTHFIGATATPTRMDNFDVCSHFFGDHLTYIYTLFDAIKAGMIQKPNYCYATYDIKKDLENAVKESGQSMKDDIVANMMNAKAIELSKLYNMPNIIKDVCDKYAVDTNYMKFIVFFSSIAHMEQKVNDVAEWFHEAYPEHTINTLRISSANNSEASNTDKLDLLTPQDKHIDLIACIDMLNMGYHVNNQTGILMYRGTKSNTIFTQQLGRALSVGANNSAIVFDIVDNLHRKAVYELTVKDKKTTRAKSSKGSKATKDNYQLDIDGKSIVTYDAKGNRVETQYSLDDNGKIVDRDGNESTFVYDSVTDTVINTSSVDVPEKNINTITSECLNATGHEATYRDIISKTMAEPLAHRCKYALQLHFRSWCLNNGVPYPISDKELEEIYGLDPHDFYEEFKKIVENNKINYPLHDADKLMKVGKDGSTDTPLAICCERSGISVKEMTDLILKS